MNGYGKPIVIRNLKYFIKDFDWRNEVHKSSISLIDSENDYLSDLVSIKVQR